MLLAASVARADDCRYGLPQVKFAASFVSPLPLYTATAGYGHKGRVRSAVPCATCEAGICSGAWPLAAH